MVRWLVKSLGDVSILTVSRHQEGGIWGVRKVVVERSINESAATLNELAQNLIGFLI